MAHPTSIHATTGDAPDDATLVARAMAGEEGALNALVRRHLPAAYGVARAIVREHAAAEDVCQDCFLALVPRLGECQPPSMFRAWLLRSVRNRAISMLRRERVRATAPLGSGEGETDVPATTESPAGAAERADLRARLAAAVAALPHVHRTVVLLHDVEGWTHAEIAALLGVAAGTSRSHLFDARRRLRALLADCGARERTRVDGRRARRSRVHADAAFA